MRFARGLAALTDRRSPFRVKSRPMPAIELLEERPLLAAAISAPPADTLSATLEPIDAAPGQQVSENASLLAPDADVQAGAVTATLDWGDGQTTSGTIVSGNDGNFVIEFTHTYNQAGTYPLQLQVVDSANGAAVTQAGSSQIAAGNPAEQTGVPISQDPGPITVGPAPTVLTAAGGSAGTVANRPSSIEALFASHIEPDGSRHPAANDQDRHPMSARRLLNREAQHHRIAPTRTSHPGANRR